MSYYDDIEYLNKKLKECHDKYKQLEAERQKWFNSSRDADLECIRLRREIKQLKREFEMITKDRDDRVHEFYESNEENQRLTEYIEEAIEARKAMSFYASGIRLDVKVVANTLDQITGILQKALEGK